MLDYATSLKLSCLTVNCYDGDFNKHFEYILINYLRIQLTSIARTKAKADET